LDKSHFFDVFESTFCFACGSAANNLQYAEEMLLEQKVSLQNLSAETNIGSRDKVIWVICRKKTEAITRLNCQKPKKLTQNHRNMAFCPKWLFGIASIRIPVFNPNPKSRPNPNPVYLIMAQSLLHTII